MLWLLVIDAVAPTAITAATDGLNITILRIDCGQASVGRLQAETAISSDSISG